MRTHLAAGALVLVLSCGTTHQSPEPSAHGTLLTHAKVYGQPSADAILFDESGILAVGLHDVLAGRAARAIDARGGLVLPGFIDPHVHLLKGGLALAQVQLADAATIEQVQAAVARYRDQHPGTGWIQGRGWSYELAPPGGYPSRAALDAVSPDRPVVLVAYDGHALWCNSAALAHAGITADTPNPVGGTIVRELDGTPAGVLLESARALMQSSVPPPSHTEKLDALAAALDHAVALGVTTVGDVSYQQDRMEDLAELERQGRLPVRVVVGLPLDAPLAAIVARSAVASEKVTLGFAKGFVDGVLESRTALLVDPYPGTSDHGHPLLTEDALRAQVAAAYAAGLPVALHAIGDGAVRMSLDVFEATRALHPEGAPPSRIEHIEIVHPDDVPRFAALDVIASMQPFHALPSDAPTASGKWAESVGDVRMPRTFAWRTLLRAGATLAFGSDWPVMSMDPLLGIAVATTRQNKRLLPAAGRQPEQRLTVDEAVQAYTAGSARALGLSAPRIAPGLPADLVVLRPGVDLDRPRTLWEGERIEAVIVAGNRAR